MARKISEGKKFWRKKKLVNKYCNGKKFLTKKIWTEKNYQGNKFLVEKKFWWKKMSVKKTPNNTSTNKYP